MFTDSVYLPACPARRRRLARGFSGLALLLSAFFFAAPAIAQVVSHGFEDGSTQGWMPRGPVTLSASTDVAQDGARSLKTAGRTGTWNGPALNLLSRLAPNATYQIAGWVRLVAGQPTSNLKFTVERTPVSGSTGYTQVNAAQPVTDGAWVYLQGNYTFPAEASTAVTLYLESDSATAEYYLDSFTITALTAASCPEPLDQSGLYTDFESGGNEGWGPRGAAVLANSAALAASGERSLAVTNRGASWQGPAINALCKLHKGSKYLISVQVRMLPGEPDSQMRVSLQAGLNGATSFLTVIGNTNVTDAAWVQLSTEYTFGSDVDQLQLYVETAAGTASFAIDDFLLAHIPAKPIEAGIPSLKDVLADDFPIGTAIETNELVGVHRDLLLKHFSQFTAGNAMKWDALQPTEGNFAFGRADALANFARANGLRMRGHTLVWHSQTPAWVFRDGSGNPLEAGNPAHRELLLQRMKTHIQTVVPRYADVVYAWDVVNEAIDENQPGGLRNSPWLQIIGPDYIDHAFRFAREAAGTTGLYINDYSTENPAKREALRVVVQGLLDRGVPVDGVGHQAHINIAWPSLADIRATLETFAAMGLPNEITEFDMSVYTNSTDTTPPTPEQLVTQGYRYRDVFNLYRELSPIINSVTVWGLADDNSWLKTFPIRRDDKPLFFDEELQSKPAYWGVVDPGMLPVVPKDLNVTQARARFALLEEPFWDAIAGQPLTSSEIDGSWAAFKATWDGDSIHLLLDVADRTRTLRGGDSVDVFIGDAKYTFRGYGKKRSGGAEAIIVPTLRGYRLKAAIPAGGPLAVGDTLAFDIRVTDSATGDRLSWSDTHHGQDTSTDDFGTLMLIPQKKLARAVRGTPVIDGAIDKAWARATAFETRTFVLGSTGATARLRTMWDDGHLYVLAQVSDPLLSEASPNAWEEDSVEIFIDANNAQLTTYDGDDSQFRVNFANAQSFGGAAAAGRIVSATTTVAGGYIIEAAIALEDLPRPGRWPFGDRVFIGFDLQVNDDGLGDGVRSSVATWNDTTGRAYLDPSQFGAIELVGHPRR